MTTRTTSPTTTQSVGTIRSPARGPATTRLPDGFTARIRDDVRWHERADGGAVLIGGSPLRSVVLSPIARRLVEDRRITVADPASATVARRLLDANLADPVLDNAAGVGSHIRRAQLTVVVPVRDRAAQLDRCLTALTRPAGLAGPAALHVIVVDDGSRDPDAVAEVVARRHTGLIRLPANLGPAGARNAGLDAVRTPYVAFVDSDVTVGPDALLALAGHLDDPAVALVGPLVRGIVRPQRPRGPKWHERYDAAASSLALGERAGSVRAGAAVGWLPSACLVGRTDALRAAGGFEAGMRVGEDVDLVWRLVAAGWRVRYEPGLEARHDVRPTAVGWLSRKVAYGTGSALLAERHGDAVAVARLSPLMAAAGAGLLIRRPWSLAGAAVAVCWSARVVHQALPEFDGRRRAAAALAVRGLGWSARQESALVLRHWWPAASALAVFSPTARRALATALVVDAVVTATVDRPLRRPDIPRIGILEIAVGRRLDDLAYGLGLWVGAARRRSWKALSIKMTPTSRRVSAAEPGSAAGRCPHQIAVTPSSHDGEQ